MTGMLGVGIGEVVIPQLVKKNGVPLPVAAGTSVLVVFLNAVGELSIYWTTTVYTGRASNRPVEKRADDQMIKTC